MFQLTSVQILPDIVVLFFSSNVLTPDGLFKRHCCIIFGEGYNIIDGTISKRKTRVLCILPCKQIESSQYGVLHGLSNDAVECPGARDISVCLGVLTVSSLGTLPRHLVGK
jgi:hypothetical protein